MSRLVWARRIGAALSALSAVAFLACGSFIADSDAPEGTANDKGGVDAGLDTSSADDASRTKDLPHCEGSQAFFDSFDRDSPDAGDALDGGWAEERNAGEMRIDAVGPTAPSLKVVMVSHASGSDTFYDRLARTSTISVTAPKWCLELDVKWETEVADYENAFSRNQLVGVESFFTTLTGPSTYFVTTSQGATLLAGPESKVMGGFPHSRWAHLVLAGDFKARTIRTSFYDREAAIPTPVSDQIVFNSDGNVPSSLRVVVGLSASGGAVPASTAYIDNVRLAFSK